MAKWIYRREAQYLFNYEKTVAEKSKVSFFVSEQEAALFKRLAPELGEKITYINNGVDTNHFSPDHLFDSPYSDNKDVLVFTGAMDYRANVDAVTWFGKAVFPHLKKYPQAKFYIVGSKPSKEVQKLANNKNIIVTGAVDGVRPYVAHAKLIVENYQRNSK